MAMVTIVVATYNRPQSLRYTISSILRQSYKDWVLLVIGDQCSGETADLMTTYDDKRIVYHNLDTRCGEQSGPNSVGFFLAKTKYVAFANHDDIWLQDHLERAVKTMEEEGTEFYCAGAALTTYATDMRTNEQRPVVWEKTPEQRSFEEVYYYSSVLFEPVSAWVVKRSLLTTIGVWRPAAQVFRTPLVDWLLRAWRAGVSYHFSPTATVIYCNAEKRGMTNTSEGGALYSNTTCEGRYWLDKFDAWSSDKVREYIANEEKFVAPYRTWSFFKNAFADKDYAWVFAALLTPDTARVFLETGWDGFEQASKLCGIKRGQTLAGMLAKRTGEALQRHSTWKSVAHNAQRQLEGNQRWRKANYDV
ncbi:glycosyltransferase family 2 protein [Kordiimonas sp.]|uniref:glycosyltransferase family 2 protein n=1 Tax=Kordiimonas sp. TaxID=1970157 RepID=UPI003A953EF5